MKKIFFILLTVIIISIPARLFAADDEDYIDGDTVNKHETGELLDGGLVEKVEKPTAVPTAAPAATEVPATPVPAPTEKPKPTPKPVIKPTPKKAVKAQPTAVPTPVPTPVPQPAKRSAEFAVVQAMAEEVAKKRNFENYFGLLDRDRKFRLIFTIQNTGEQPSFYSTAALISGHSSIIVAGIAKDLQTVLANDKRELTYELVILGSYDGGSKLPLTLKVKAAGFERDYPLDIYIEQENPYVLYAIAGGILILLIILIIILTRRRSGGGGGKKDFDFEIK